MKRTRKLSQSQAVYGALILALVAASLSGCTTPTPTQTAAAQTVATPVSTQSAAAQGSGAQAAAPQVEISAPAAVNATNWNAASHGDEAEPNYAVVFPQESVNRIDITLSTEAWAALQAEMTEQFGAQGQGNAGQMPGGGQPPQGQMPGSEGQPPAVQTPSGEAQPPQGQMPGGGQPPAGQRPPGNFQPGGQPGNGMGPGLDFGDTSYVSSQVSFNGETWENVGFRYSGNSTLQSSWRSGTQKISFRLDFDEFEDQDPAIKNQRFYGFKQISFKSNAMDSSYLREKVAADIFRAAGVVASQTAFYEVYVDYGAGPQYFGLYTAVEIVDDTVIKTQFSADSGNVYKPEGTGAAFVAGTFNAASFEKQTNQEEADWSDIQAVFAALNSELRTTDPAAWRAGLEAVFDVEAFIRWLAVDTIMQNWDTYGSIAHNYYLYTDPEDGLVTWIPWDNNMSLSASAKGPGGGNNRGGGNNARPGGGVRELDLSAVGDQWPLIRFLMDDPVYLAAYQRYLEETIQGAFQPETLAATYQKYHALIAPYVQRETTGYTQLASIETFNQSVDGLIQHAQSRYAAVVAYLAAK
jgi:spore coat protein CotH